MLESPPSLSFPSPTIPFSSSPFTCPPLSLALPLEVCPLNPARESGECCKLPQEDLGQCLPFLSFPSPTIPLSSPPFTYPFLSLSLAFPLEVGPLNPTRGSGECCKLPQQGLGQCPSRNRFWCILAVKYDIWWQQFH